ncbi:endonuclease domain-containing protein [Microbacterium tumbae]
MDVISKLGNLGGVAQVSALLEAGATPYDLRRAKSEGAVYKVRNGWVALPGADPMLVTAARRGVVLTCATLAARRGLWVRDAVTVHVGASAHAGHARPGDAIVHWNRPLIPRRPGAVEDSLVDALVIASSCLGHEDALTLWESALRKGAVHAEQMRRLPLPASARRMLADARPWSDSGLESIVVHRLGWLKLPITQQVWLYGHWVDVVVGERLVIQIDGGHHVGAQRSEDIAHDALLTLQGYHVIRIGYDQIMNHWTEVQAMIMAAVAQGLHLA